MLSKKKNTFIEQIYTVHVTALKTFSTTFSLMSFIDYMHPLLCDRISPLYKTPTMFYVIYSHKISPLLFLGVDVLIQAFNFLRNCYVIFVVYVDLIILEIIGT